MIKYTVHQETSTHWRVTNGFTDVHIALRPTNVELPGQFEFLTGGGRRVFETFGEAVGAAINLIEGR